MGSRPTATLGESGLGPVTLRAGLELNKPKLNSV
jgi:hypothetical protein